MNHEPPLSAHPHQWQQDGRVVKAPSFGVERTKYTPDMPGSNPAAEKKSIGCAVGDAKHVPSLLWLAKTKVLLRQQEGRVVKAPSFGGEQTKYTPDMPGSNLAAKKVHRLGGW